LVWALLPQRVIPYNDDFGYFRSVIATIQHGRPWTDEWLEPWAASLSLLSAGIYRVTGSFTAATHGLLAILAGLTCLGWVELLRRRNVPFGWAVFVALAVLLFPTCLWKELEFTALALYLPCLVWALLCYEKRNWLGFFLCWGLAIMSRQSAVAWGLLPLYACFTNRRNGHSLTGPIATLAGGLALYFVFSSTMNHTHAQAVMTGRLFEHLHWQTLLPHTAIGAAIFLLGAGLALTVSELSPPPRLRKEGMIRVAAIAAALALTGMYCGPSLGFEDQGTFGGGIPLIALLSGVSLYGWWLGGKLRLEYALCAAGCIGLTGLRAAIWDYYYLDVLIIALLSAGRAEFGTAAAPRAVFGPAKRIAAAVFLSIALFYSSRYAIKLKRQLDDYQAIVTLCDQALRARKITEADLSIAPFGYAGWVLYPYFITHEGSGAIYIGAFTRYLKPAALTLETRGASDKRPVVEKPLIVAEGVFRILWREHHRFMLRKADNVAPAELLLTDTERRLNTLPLNDAEWTSLIDRP
jgi:hypothetical protein